MRERFTGILALGLVLAVACSGASRKSQPGVTDGGVLTVASSSDGLILEQADLDANGKVDVWTYSRDVPGKDGSKVRQLVRRTADLNGDGRPDLTQWFDETGEVVKEEIDLDFDGRADLVRTFRKGKIEQEQGSSRFDGLFDIRKYYEDGVLVLKQVDTRHNGKFDEFQYFQGGKLYRLGRDKDGDGKPEVFEESE